MKLREFVSVITMCLIILSVNSCSKSKSTTDEQSGGGNATTVNISGMAFPATTTVAKGTRVTWHNMDAYPHTVTSDDGTSFDSNNLPVNGTFSYVANTEGSFDYHCNLHSNMRGTLKVTP